VARSRVRRNMRAKEEGREVEPDELLARIGLNEARHTFASLMSALASRRVRSDHRVLRIRGACHIATSNHGSAGLQWPRFDASVACRPTTGLGAAEAALESVARYLARDLGQVAPRRERAGPGLH
jgi:hypothetical protein